MSTCTNQGATSVSTVHRHGYYEYPRRVSSEKLAERVGISKPVLLQHLRKAEGRIMADIFAGQ